jgi:hypothetical protein
VNPVNVLTLWLFNSAVSTEDIALRLNVWEGGSEQ